MWEPAWSQEMARTAPLLPPMEGRGRIIHSVPPLAQGPAVPSLSSKNNSLSSEFSGPRVDSVRRIASSLSPATHFASAKRVRFGDAVLPHAPLASPYRDSGSSARMSQNAGPSVPSSLTPIRCTTAGTSIVPLEPLARRLEAWLALPSPSRWLTRTIRLGYAIQFARRPPKFSGVLETAVAARNAPVLREEIAVLLARMQSSRSPPAEMKQGFYSPYFIVPKKDGGLRPILDCDSWTGPCTGSRLRCWRTGAWSNAYSPGIGLQRSTWRMLTFMFRSFRDTDRSTVCVRGSGMAVQGPPLRALPVRPCLHEDRGGCPCPVTGSGHQDPQLSRAWPARENSYAITGTWCFGTSASWGFRSTGKRASSPLRRESLFSVWS